MIESARLFAAFRLPTETLADHFNGTAERRRAAIQAPLPQL
jgi:hypothetical protein